MSKSPDREKSAAGRDPEPRPESSPAPSGGIEGGTIFVGLIIVGGLVLLALKLAGVIG